MFKTPLNEKIVTVKMKRHDLCELMLGCAVLDAAAALDQATDEKTTKWAKLHDQLKEILDDFDSKQEF